MLPSSLPASLASYLVCSDEISGNGIVFPLGLNGRDHFLPGVKSFDQVALFNLLPVFLDIFLLDFWDSRYNVTIFDF